MRGTWTYLHIITMFMLVLVILGTSSSLFFSQGASWSLGQVEGVEMSVVVDWVSSSFLIMVTCISSMVLYYSIGYMDGWFN